MATETPTHAGRFEWERALLDSALPWHLKAFMLLLGTKMDVDGRNCKPSAPWLMSKMGRSRQRVFEMLKEIEAAGWITTVRRGKTAVRLPRIPLNQSDPSDGLTPEDPQNPSGPSDGLGIELQPDPSDTSYGSPIPHESDPSDYTRQTHLTQPTITNQLGASARPQTPLRTESPQAAPRTELEQEPEQSKTPDAELDPETHVPPRAQKVRCEHGLAAPGRDGKPRCPICRRGIAAVAPVIQLRPPDRSAS
ncbi:hypothetical protein ACIRG5_42500 [Lentzea sp. NPDC102401]|uniref:hypothetical protein n=1 Tax=Lentzea sp. NPDC102401 TaxID=3364128 RepID=UPI00380EA24C